jgi:uroporphyrin-III C-methyltransferase
MTTFKRPRRGPRRNRGIEVIDTRGLVLPEFAAGTVWLVGAGPGDPGLLSLLALHALAHADNVVYDALVDWRILELARPDAVLAYAGKRGGRPSARQPDISAELVRLARQGRRVLRLKGGDPCVFGRGAEEALALVAAGIPFRIVPGITAGIGGLAYAGIPLTHRATNSAATFVTGHNSDGAMPDGLDWQAIAHGSPVIILYMALKHLPNIVARLVGAGRDRDEPAAVVGRATTEAQRVVVSCLGEIAAAAADVETPAIVVIGEVVRLRAGLDWLGALAGRSLDPDPLGQRQCRAAD